MTIQRIGRAIAYRTKRSVKKGFLRIKATSSFIHDLKEFKKQIPADTDFPMIKYYPLIFDKYTESGIFSTHYFQQDLLIAQRIFSNKPEKHVDIGSRVDGFVTHVASYREIEIIDIRPLDRKIVNVSFRQADLMKLPEGLLGYTDSISSLHVIEHFGLGRYGDPIDVNGHLKALDNILRILKSGGKFYFSVPVGVQGVYFNAHRLFSVSYLVDLLENNYRVDNFYLIDDKEILHLDLDFRSTEAASSFGCVFGCAIFELTKN